MGQHFRCEQTLYTEQSLTGHKLFAGVRVIDNDLGWLESESKGILIGSHLVDEGLCSVGIQELEGSTTLRTVADTEYQTDVTINLGRSIISPKFFDRFKNCERAVFLRNQWSQIVYNYKT